MSEKTRIIVLTSFVALVMILSLIFKPDWSMFVTEIVVLIVTGLIYLGGRMLRLWN